MLTGLMYVLVPMPYLFFGSAGSDYGGYGSLASGWVVCVGGGGVGVWVAGRGSIEQLWFGGLIASGAAVSGVLVASSAATHALIHVFSCVLLRCCPCRWIDAGKFLTGFSAVGSIAIPAILAHAQVRSRGARVGVLPCLLVFEWHLSCIPC